MKYFCLALVVNWLGLTPIDRRLISTEIGPISKKLQDEYFATVRGKVAKYSNWCTKVSINNN